MQDHRITINLDTKCKQCGEDGAIGATGLCMACVLKNLKNGEYNHVLKKTLKKFKQK